MTTIEQRLEAAEAEVRRTQKELEVAQAARSAAGTEWKSAWSAAYAEYAAASAERCAQEEPS